MLNFVEFVIGLFVVIALMILIILITGIVYNRDGYVSVIEKRKQFYKIEMRKFSWHLPILYRKVAYYPTNKGHIIINHKKINYQVVDVMKLYKHKKKVKDILMDKKNSPSILFLDYGIKIINQ